MKKYLVPFMILLSGLIFALPRIAAAQDPVVMLDNVATQMISELKSHKATLKTNPGLVYTLTNRIVVPHANLDAMAQHVLPPQTWKSATPAQREQFKKQFTRVLERTYASALANYTDESVRFYPVRGGVQGKTSITVNSEIVRSDSPAIRVKYRVLSAGGNWKLYDMSVEGVSMLDSFRSQFADKLSRGNIAELISTLQQHNARS